MEAILRAGLLGLAWETIRSPAFYFEHAATILVVQGMVLQDFFPPDVRFVNVASLDETPIAEGPFLLLKGELSMPWDPPLRLKNMVLAKVTKMPEDMTREQLLAILLRLAT
jgi:hypothetical protein